jgi:hypothetical protein
MAILQTDADSIALTDNSGKQLVRTSGSVIDVGFSSNSLNYNTNPPNIFQQNQEVNGLTVSITPKSSSSKFLLSAHINFNGTPLNFFFFNFRRYVNGSFSANLGSSAGITVYSSDGQFELRGTHSPVSFSWLDSPSTTATLTYGVGARATGGTAYYNRYDGILSTLRVLEIV